MSNATEPAESINTLRRVIHAVRTHPWVTVTLLVVAAAALMVNSAFFAVLVAFVIAYLASVEIAKYFFYRTAVPTTARPLRRDRAHRVHRLAARWSHHQPLPR